MEQTKAARMAAIEQLTDTQATTGWLITTTVHREASAGASRAELAMLRVFMELLASVVEGEQFLVLASM
jgi:hypothetical protein